MSMNAVKSRTCRNADLGYTNSQTVMVTDENGCEFYCEIGTKLVGGITYHRVLAWSDHYPWVPGNTTMYVTRMLRNWKISAILHGWPENVVESLWCQLSGEKYVPVWVPWPLYNPNSWSWEEGIESASDEVHM